ncbi:MAG: hypothetical protein HUU35_17895, partial [Armatimonadetes bacterium]|nr:hypothetical protein [Armatimonadota bacterium]
EHEGRAAQVGMWTGYKAVEGLAQLPRPYRNNGRLMVPLRPLVTWLGARLTVYPNGRVVAANSELAVVTVPEQEAGQINGKWRELDMPMESHGGVIFTPIHLFTAAAGAQATTLANGEIHLKYKENWTLLPGA